LEDISKDINALHVAENTKILGHVLRTNVAACSAVGSGFSVQIARIYVTLLELYKAVSQIISNTVANEGKNYCFSRLIDERLLILLLKIQVSLQQKHLVSVT
jgi:hypothetical protein